MNLSRGIIQLIFSVSLFVTLYGQLPNLDDENELLMNYTTLWDLLKPQSNPYLQELSGHWSFNDTVDLTKYEEFDHTRFEGTRELSLEEVLTKVRERAKIKANQARVNIKRPPTPPPEDLPTFDPDQLTNSTAQLGGTAYLSCRIKNLNNRAVSWVRKRDWHILTSAMFTYTNDERFQVMHAEGSEEWVLQIKFVQRRDAGEYECQVRCSDLK
ncbi:hypothetical protein GE061_015690 [Apolygus lucorum]|uniref:Ig-like domain-containing protein n=1 Tax=Apolygus lucorum TaxID=248454 RepID=A0A8S9XPI3_APOLU|nr:hypothetical protein GE061_015690 [Apolygus lucorum]